MIRILGMGKRALVRAAACVSVILLLGGAAEAAPILFGVTGAGGAESILYTIDPLSGATALIGPTGFSHVTGIDFDPTTGILYGVLSDFRLKDDDVTPLLTQLLTIDTATGMGAVVGPMGNQIPDITIGPDGILRGWSETGDNAVDDVVVINKATGATDVTQSELVTSLTGVATESPTTLYVKSGNSLYSVDVTTGGSTFLMSTDLSDNLDNLLENTPSGLLLTGQRIRDVDGLFLGTQFYEIDPVLGTTTALGFSDGIAFSGIAYGEATVVPEPSTLTLLALGLAGLGLRRKRATGVE